ncbi:MAG: NADPH-dependent F420 reductase [Candidatus Heimdallarchaeota archaeon]|nr:MAG: NADPH-dependent F420 reductase [Candidatus Heimdallarchaeota archaeon]
MAKIIGMIGGTGPQGQGLALRWGMAGESVIMGSRQQEKADRISAEVNEKLGKDLVIPRTNEACVKESDIILCTTPFDYIVKTITPFIKYFTADHIIVDVTVPLKPFEKGKMVDVLPELQDSAKSATELLRKVIPREVPLVGAFKTLSNATLQDVDRLPVLNQDVFIFGRDKVAKHIIKEKAALIKNLRPVDSGGTLSARHVERFTAFLIGLNRRYKTHDCGFNVTGLTERDW